MYHYYCMFTIHWYYDTLIATQQVFPFQLQDGAKPWRRILDEKLKLWPAAWREKNDGWRNLETNGNPEEIQVYLISSVFFLNIIISYYTYFFSITTFLCSLHVTIFLFLLSCWWLILKQNWIVIFFWPLCFTFLQTVRSCGSGRPRPRPSLRELRMFDAQFQIRTAARTPSFWSFSWSNFKATGCGCRETKILRIAGNVDLIPSKYLDR